MYAKLPMPMPYKSADFYSLTQCIILYGNIFYQETAVCAVCHCIDLENMIYMH